MFSIGLASALYSGFLQLSVEHFYRSARKNLDKHRDRLKNPLCFEFGIRTEEQLNQFIENELTDFRLVRGYFRPSPVGEEIAADRVIIFWTAFEENLAERRGRV